MEQTKTADVRAAAVVRLARERDAVDTESEKTLRPGNGRGVNGKAMTMNAVNGKTGNCKTVNRETVKP